MIVLAGSVRLPNSSLLSSCNVKVVFNFICSLATMACLMTSVLNLVCLLSYLFPSTSLFLVEVLYFLLQIDPAAEINRDKLQLYGKFTLPKLNLS